MAQKTKNSRIIQATPQVIYQALTDPKALAVWQAPNDMTASVHDFELCVGGGYTMSLFYPENEKEMAGKTDGKEDRFTSRFVELTPNKKIVQAIRFDTTSPELMGEMIMEITLTPMGTATNVTFVFKNIPRGIKTSDNEAGTASSLEKLAKYVG